VLDSASYFRRNMFSAARCARDCRLSRTNAATSNTSRRTVRETGEETRGMVTRIPQLATGKICYGLGVAARANRSGSNICGPQVVVLNWAADLERIAR
jgi:hypothetical protein